MDNSQELSRTRNRRKFNAEYAELAEKNYIKNNKNLCEFCAPAFRFISILMLDIVYHHLTCPNHIPFSFFFQKAKIGIKTCLTNKNNSMRIFHSLIWPA